MRRFDLHQDMAEANARRLIIQMVFVQLATILVSGIVISACLTFVNGILFELDRIDPLAESAGRYETSTIFIITLCLTMTFVGSVIAFGGFFKYHELKAGGKKVALTLRGTPIDATTEKKKERQLLNVVQELAIASGITPPSAYVLKNESGINAFAAGHTFDDAVIVITEGALNRLSRDQLQGVVAHEFSHILNGDMARNMKLIAFTHGNFAVCTLAEFLIAQEVNLDQNSGLAVTALNFLGWLLLPFGILNSSIACLFTASIKRQGEYLADATAVELARYPNGLSDALMMIAGNKDKGRIRRPGAGAVNYLFLVDGVNCHYHMFDSHPLLDDRILRLRPDWDGYYLHETADELGAYGEAWDDVVELVGLAKTASTRKQEFAEHVSQVMPIAMGAMAANTNAKDTPANARQVDTLTAGQDGVPQWLAIDSTESVELDPNIREMAFHPEVAGLVLAALRLEQFEPDAASEIISQLNPLVTGPITKVRPVIAGLEEDQKLWLFDHALDTIAKAPRLVRSLFVDFVAKATVAPEAETNLARWAWQRVVDWHVNPQEKINARYGEMEQVNAEVLVILSALTHSDSEGEMESNYNFMRAAAHIELSTPVMIPAHAFGIVEIDQALDELKWLSARLRREVVVACAIGTTANRSINLDEAWLMRAICCGLNFPLPQLYPGQKLVPGI